MNSLIATFQPPFALGSSVPASFQLANGAAVPINPNTNSFRLLAPGLNGVPGSLYGIVINGVLVTDPTVVGAAFITAIGNAVRATNPAFLDADAEAFADNLPIAVNRDAFVGPPPTP